MMMQAKTTASLQCGCISINLFAKSVILKFLEGGGNRLIGSVCTSFTEIYSDSVHFVASILDPCYNDHYLDAENESSVLF